jgi:hypothetical protein
MLFAGLFRDSLRESAVYGLQFLERYSGWIERNYLDER